MGDFQTALDAFILTALCCFLIGFIYIVLLRFFIGPCVWLAVFLVLLSLLLGGSACYIKSFQCAGRGRVHVASGTLGSWLILF